MKDLEKDLDFILEVDKMKSIFRRSINLSNDRRENDAEHSFYVAISSMILEDYADNDIDKNKVIRMLLVHDLVEIDADDTFAYDTLGYKTKVEIDADDTFAYDTLGYKTKYEKEQKAADRLFSILSGKKAVFYRNLYDEFEEAKTEESKFANLIDRILPIFLNYYNNGGTWKEAGISKDMVINRIRPFRNSSKALYDYVLNLLDKYFG